MSKISICIPVYNFEVSELIFDLKKEIDSKNLDAEILLIDDASDQFYRNANQGLENVVETYIKLDKNVGRSQIRNLFLYYSHGNYLLFLDCDGKIVSDDFLSKYFEFIAENKSAKVIYGGRNVAQIPPDSTHILRWKFATERENLKLEKRLRNPYLAFQTNNFLVKKTVLEKVNFNPEFQKYGYEDLLFAMDLKAKNFEISHIENPIFNKDLETNAVYLAKVEESIDSLVKMYKNKNTGDRIQEIRLIKAYHKITNSKAENIFMRFFDIRRNAVRKRLLSEKTNLRYLDFYKLGLFLIKMKSHNNER